MTQKPLRILSETPREQQQTKLFSSGATKMNSQAPEERHSP